ncbi:MAG: luciferase [Haloferacaceae archaeon]
MGTTDDPALAAAGLDGVALKPSECDPRRAAGLSPGTVVVDYEGPGHMPDEGTLRDLAAASDLRVTVPVRADGFDPLGDDARARGLPPGVGRVLVAGNPAYLSERERERAVAPRLGAAREAWPDAWVGTEGIERLALAAGGTQFELLAPRTRREVRSLRAAGFGGTVALYAPVVPTDDDDAVLDAVGAYVARRGPVAGRLPEGATTDAGATGRARSVLLDAAADYALVGPPARIRERIERLREAGVDLVVGYPAGGLESLRG